MSSAEQKKTQEVSENEEQVIKSLEEDDEFEDFPDDESKWVTDAKLKEESLWEQDWDDDDNQDQFSQKLREELIKSQKPAN
ncbi:DSS1/SEM1 family protein [Candida parapsilosis]|uniref:26S proteasome complex subunit SEM1 n=2 Tax=Candida parapsilosis TaxID=5480 RepID=G8BDL1_CANPC|nr:uncharacterized protein CPAR2_210030 [Candida parapsilosis]KAF6054493.1 DSS1/SEM1 family protein [Candida parapsilosis]KAF6056482.1 DSS1/SEM1 family protein [Candida parapsilosis]KAF6059416.1 DSS1/SEM1 family protein [Candida parapsilosis]KAF6068171.1 DSS1/SEM1 family protein [Candida parapsilosis]KAI5905347.1 hypothetical protein K4G60_g4606 [Candida parapsilosis]